MFVSLSLHIHKQMGVSLGSQTRRREGRVKAQQTAVRTSRVSLTAVEATKNAVSILYVAAIIVTIIIIIINIIHSLTMKVVGAPQMLSQLLFSIFPCSSLPSGTWRTPGLPIS